MKRAHPAPLLLASLLAGCGDSGVPSDGDTPTPAPGFSVSGFVFYDENGNGLPDSGEGVRLPGVTVAVGSRSGPSSTGGRFSIPDVPAGAQTVLARPETLPADFRPGAPRSVAVPAVEEVAVPAVLPLDPRMKANVYMAFGDSITEGDGSSGGGYREPLQAALRQHWGRADVVNEGQTGTRSDDGAWRISASLGERRPAYALILYGTNDWNRRSCRDNPPCDAVENLRSMVQVTRDDWGAHPILGTIPPVNPLFVDERAEERNAWVVAMNDALRTMASSEHVPLAEVHRAFLQQPDFARLFGDRDRLHPNDAGYALISRAFFDAITGPYGAVSPSADRALFTH